MLRLMGPRIIALGAFQAGELVRDNLASRLADGSVTALTFGWFIMQVPETMLGTAIAIALLPTISEIFARGELDQFRDTINGAVRAILSLTIPSAVLLAIGLRPLLETAFPGYTPTEVDLIVLVTRVYLLGLAGHALLEIGARSFYAQKNAITPLFAAALNATGYIVIALLLSRAYGIGGIAAANSLAFTAEALVLLWLLNRAYPGLLNVRRTLVRVVLGAGSGAALLFAIMRLAPIRADVAAAGGMLLGLAAAGLFILPELKMLLWLGGKSSASP